MLLGYAMPGRGETIFKEILPYDTIEGGDAAVLGNFTDFCERLFVLARALGTHRSLKEWGDFLSEVLEQFFLADDETERDMTFIRRVLHDLGDLRGNRPVDVKVSYSQHYCSHCDIYFNAEMDDLALPKAHYTHRVVSMAVRLVVEDGLPYRTASWHLWRDHRVFVPFATIQNWVEAGGKKGRGTRGHGVSGRGPGRLQRVHRGR